MINSKVKISTILESQLPNFVREEYPLVSEFLSQYYTSLESQSLPLDLLENIDQYIKIDELTEIVDSSALTLDFDYPDTTLTVDSTYGFPDSYGLILIDSEIITYTSKTDTTFEGCIRGFSGVTKYEDLTANNELTFENSQIDSHLSGTTAKNLSILFLKEFFIKIKKQIAPGFEERELYSNLNQKIFFKQIKDFYGTKGSDESFRILFKALYGDAVEVIKPRDFLIKPSDAEYNISKNLVVESISGDPLQLINRTLYQDSIYSIDSAKGVVSNVEKIRRDNKTYYVISLDYGYNRDIEYFGTIYGKFSIHPKTKIINSLSQSTSLVSIDVDSTVGFPNSGELTAKLPNGTDIIINYQSKSLTQFLDCSGIDQDLFDGQEVNLNAFAYGNGDNDEIIKIRIGGVIEDLKILDSTFLFEENDEIKLKTLGKDIQDYKANNWIFNLPLSYKVKSIELLSSTNDTLKYKISLFDDHIFKINDTASLIASNNVIKNIKIERFENKNSFIVITDKLVEEAELNISNEIAYTLKRKINKLDVKDQSDLSVYNTDIQNIYTDLKESFYVTSSSLPSYSTSLEINNKTVYFSGTFNGTDLNIGKHNFYTGDSVFYTYDKTLNLKRKSATYLDKIKFNTLGIDEGFYFIYRVSNTVVRLSRSKDDIFKNRFLSYSADVINNSLQLASLTNKKLQPQKIIKQIPFNQNTNQFEDKEYYKTKPGKIGIFVNGVELLNYKSKDNIFYGDIEKISVLNSGTDYDIINPPILSISDSIGYGSSAHCSVIGSLARIDIVDSGFDYLETPQIIIEGGNGIQATAEASLISFVHSSYFNPQNSIDYQNDIIGFSTYHKFRNHEKIIYETDGNVNVPGISTNSEYYVSIQDQFNIKLYKSFDESVSGINTISLTYSNVSKGIHKLTSSIKKKKIGSIKIKNSGKNYQNKKVVVLSEFINIEENSITIPDHNYKSGEIVVYTCDGTPISGLVQNNSYYVTKIDDKKFKLSTINLNGSKDFYYQTKNYVNFDSSGSGKHIFNYPKITTKIIGKIGISTESSQEFDAKIVPVFRGKIDSVFIENYGYNYGSENIINFERQPSFNLNSGEGADISPIISNGKIVNILIKNSGRNYNSQPNLNVYGEGSGAILTPIISGGKLISVKIISGGLGYSTNNTKIEVIPAGNSASFRAKLKVWNINIVEKSFNEYEIASDDGFIDTENTLDQTIQYTHAYVPRKLREIVFAKKNTGGNISYVPDLYKDLSDNEINFDSHSPIIGWAYDGNPIYGPYGYENIDGGKIKALKSGYSLVDKSNRPAKSLYPLGIFVEDYEYQNIGDLDENNGRFCVTPEYPNGIYAYFCTINGTYVESQPSQFFGYIKPKFPYVIGNYFKSNPIEFNFNKLTNQDTIDINNKNWLRNTTPYNLLSSNTNYEYITKVDNIKSQISKVKFSSAGSINSIDILSSGKNYKVNDEIIFDTSDLSIIQAKAKISSIEGKSISNISVASTSIENVQIIKYENSSYIGFSTVPHNLLSGDLVSFTSKYDYKKSGLVKIKQNKLNLTVGIDSTAKTGIVTYFYVSGSLKFPDIVEDDIYEIANEKIKVLNIDQLNSKIRVLRNQNGTIGVSSYASGQILSENSRKFDINLGITSSYNLELNKIIYFNPKESIGLGLTSGVGIGSTLYFSNSGAGNSSIVIPTKTIYLPNHKLNTGNSLYYTSNGGATISVSINGSSSFSLVDNSILYAVKVSNDLIGLSTSKIGLNSTGNYTGFGTITSNTLYFNNFGSGDVHKFITNYDNILNSSISKNIVTVSTAETHGLSVLDSVNISCISGLSTTVTIKYNNQNNRLVANLKQFNSLDVDILNDSITIKNHNYVNGQKVIHTSSISSGGLVNNKIYYILIIDKNTIKLCSNYYNSVKDLPENINITSASFGTLSSINPPIFASKNNTIIFDLSDSSLSYNPNSGISTYSAFTFEIYSDRNYRNNYYISTSTSSNFDVVKIGQIGISSDAKVILTVNENTPENLYYNLKPIGISTFNKLITDNENIVNNNSIILTHSEYSGTYNIISISSTSFSYNILNYPEISAYDPINASLNYHTNSLSASGGIKEVVILNSGKNYKKLPGISTITTKNGSDAVLYVKTNNIGSIKKIKLNDIGYNYSTDYSIRPLTNLPQLLKVESLCSFDKILVKSNGYHYTSSPDLVIINNYNDELINDAKLSYNLGDLEVTILRNTNNIHDILPTIIPINNSNGVKISNISFNNTTKDVIVTLGSSFSSLSDFPFEIGDQVLVEGIGISSTGKGYNSENYNYSLFTLTNTFPNIGYYGANITYNLSEYLQDSEIPGTYDVASSYGNVTPKKHFPSFEIYLKKNEFIIGEHVKSKKSSGIVQGWDYNNGILKISTVDNFNEGDIITGQVSNISTVIKNITKFDSFYNINSYSIVDNGWNLNTGFLNDSNQRIHDSNYYQYFSYAVKSHIDYTKWNNIVTTLNHTAGFKKFSDLIIESPDTKSNGMFVGLSTEQNQGDFSSVANLSNFIDLNCVYDFDLAKEKTLKFNYDYKSNGIIFGYKILEDYIESIGNRVLVLDDISSLFNNNPRPTNFNIIDTFDPTVSNARKYIIFIQDKENANIKQILVVCLLQDGLYGYLNQYGKIESNLDIGYFDFSISEFDSNLLFYPTNYKANNYYINFISLNFNTTSVGIASTSLGDIVNISNNYEAIPQGTISGVKIAGISSSYRTSKINVEINSNNNEYYQFDELTILHDGSNIQILNFGRLNNSNLTSSVGSGLGTYNAYYANSDINLEFVPNSELTTSFNSKTFNISIGNTSFTTTGTNLFDTGYINSNYTNIPAGSGLVSIGNYSNISYSGSYYIVSIEDTTNNIHQVSEVIVLNDSSNAYITEFGILSTGNYIGSISADILGTDTHLYFNSPISSNVQIRIFQTAIGIFNDIYSSQIDLIGSNITSGYAEYTGTENDIRKDFDLTYRGKNVFKRNFSYDNVNLIEDKIRIPENFFVTGEEVLYSNTYGNPIGIATTTISGISTTILPSSVYIVKLNELDVQVAASSTDALLSTPKILSLVSSNFGSQHQFISKKQNEKCLISIDNNIQKPVVATSTTTFITNDITVLDSILRFDNITPFSGGNYIKIDNEIMKINSVGVGSTNYAIVERKYLGTKLSYHVAGSIVTKVIGDYNIEDNVINFNSFPYGIYPISSELNSPDERDYSGIATGSSFSGRVFIKSGVSNTGNEPYKNNYIFDDLSDSFTGFKTEFSLKSFGKNVTGFSTSNAIILVDNIFQSPSGFTTTGDYKLRENVGVTSIIFTGNISSVKYDVNNASVPSGGTIISVGSSNGFGYQPLVCAGGTAIISIGGTIQSISIGNSGSGYRVGIQTIVNVGIVTTKELNAKIKNIGTANILNGNVVGVSITNPGIGYTYTNSPRVVFDHPLSYSNLKLKYSFPNSGVGTEAIVDIVVGQGSSVINFELKNVGYGYKKGDILTIDYGGSIGIPTDTTKPFAKFELTVDQIHANEFCGWSIGDIQIIDTVEALFDGKRTIFPILIDREQTSIRTKVGSNIDIQATLLIFINDILQVPGKSYIFTGGSVIEFTEAPKIGDTCKFLFYRGTGDVDTKNIDILESVKVGDDVALFSDDINFRESERTVTKINSTDDIDTNLYSKSGISSNKDLIRPVTWCRQSVDKVIDGNKISKNRILYEASIHPTTNIIQNINTSSTEIFVENVRTFFDSRLEYSIGNASQGKISIISQDNIVGASATAIVSTAGTIIGIQIINGGVGYSTSPYVIIENPTGIGSTATAIVSVSAGTTISLISITNPGYGYTLTNPPRVSIQEPFAKIEKLTDVQYTGDFGIISGINTTTIGIGSTGLIFDLYIPQNSFLRNSSIVGTAITISGIQTGHYFVLSNSNIGTGLTSLRTDGTIIGYGTAFIDNIYQVHSVSIAKTSVLGIGSTYVARVAVRVSSGVAGVGYSGYYGNYSWGKIGNINRKNPQSFNAYTDGILGISTSSIIQRTTPLRYQNYTS
jgi:hypothetical protein